MIHESNKSYKQNRGPADPRSPRLQSSTKAQAPILLLRLQGVQQIRDLQQRVQHHPVRLRMVGLQLNVPRPCAGHGRAENLCLAPLEAHPHAEGVVGRRGSGTWELREARRRRGRDSQ